MERRTFLQLMLGSVVGTLVPAPFFRAAESPPIENARRIGIVREMESADILRDKIRLRFDLLIKSPKTGELMQISVDFLLPLDATEQDREKTRESAIALLERELSNDGFTWNDLVPLPSVEMYKTAFI